MRTARKNPTAIAPDDDWMTVPQAARELGIAAPTVLQRALRGELETQTLSAGPLAGRTFVSRASVEKAKANANA